MSTGYRRQQAQSGTNDLGWMLFCALVAVALCLIALPWIITGFLAQRFLSDKMYWKWSLFLWMVLLFLGAFLLYESYQHGLQSMMDHELADYIRAAKHYQADLTQWPLRALWSETWPVWIRTIAGVGIVGFVGEVYANRSDTVRTLRQQERRRQSRAARSQRRARRRTDRPTRMPNEINGMMVVGVPIDDDNQEA